ncbi:MAG: hypothetical protein IJ220_05020 [Clostridia bacterium]|nr:hypothetical protein [Clostridia bacterium]
MKKFLSKNWKTILIIIAGIFIVLNIVNKCIAPHTLVGEYAKYGPDVEASDFNINADKIINEVKESAPAGIPNNIFRIAVIFAVGLLVVAIISDISNKKPAPKKK